MHDLAETFEVEPPWSLAQCSGYEGNDVFASEELRKDRCYAFRMELYCVATSFPVGASTLTAGAFPEDGDNGWVGLWRRVHVVSEAQRATRPERKAITQEGRQKHELCNVFRRVSVPGGKAPLGVTTQSNEADVCTGH